MKGRRFGVVISTVLALALLVLASAAFAQTDKRITVDFKDVSIQNAIKMLFDGTGLNYAFESGVYGTVTVNLKDVPFDRALDIVLKTAGMTKRNEGGIYMIGPQKEATYVTSTTQPTVAVTDTTIERKLIIEKIPLGYADANDIMDVLEGNYDSGNSNGDSSYGGWGGNSGGSSFGNSSSGSSFGGNNRSSSFGNSSSSRSNRSSRNSSSSSW